MLFCLFIVLDCVGGEISSCCGLNWMVVKLFCLCCQWDWLHRMVVHLLVLKPSKWDCIGNQWDRLHWMVVHLFRLKPSQWGCIGKQRSWWEASCLHALAPSSPSSPAGWIPLMEPPGSTNPLFTPALVRESWWHAGHVHKKRCLGKGETERGRGSCWLPGSDWRCLSGLGETRLRMNFASTSLSDKFSCSCQKVGLL